MPTKNVTPLKATSNIDILNAIRYDASSEYQQRVPDATRANISDTISAMWNYRPARNEFVNALVNRIGMVLARNSSWSNPLSKFKIGMLQYGDTIEEYITGLLPAYVYDESRDYMERTLFGTDDIEAQTSFHKINRKNFYKLSVNEAQLRRAFLDPTGLSSFIGSLMDAPTKSDELDEFLAMTALFKENYDNGGYFKVNAPDVFSKDSAREDSNALLRSIRAYAEKLQFLSRHYNAANMPVSANSDDLELIVTPEVKAAIDVESLAAAFNIDRADVAGRMTVVPYENIGIVGAQAILTTKDFFVVADSVYETTEQANAASLGYNYFLHHQQVISMSRFVPAVLFTTEAGDVITISESKPTAISTLTLKDASDANVPVSAVPRGGYYAVNYTVTTDPADGDNDAVALSVAGNNSARTAIVGSALFIPVDESADKLTLTATATGDTSVTKVATLTLTGDVAQVWPVVKEEAEAPDPETTP